MVNKFSPFICFLHLERHRGEAVADFSDQFHHTLAGKGGRLTGLWQVGIQLQKLAKVGISFEGRMSSCSVHVTLKSGASSFDKLSTKSNKKVVNKIKQKGYDQA